nr:vitamin K epoxide reductase family protein [Pelotalea chapellei]
MSSMAGLILSVVSLLKICSACSETGQYRIFGMDFGWFGIAFFIAILCALILRQRYRWCNWIIALMMFSAAGAEARFIWIQKYEIGQWCPVCLGLAATVFLTCTAISWETLRSSTTQGAPMKSRILFIIVATLCFATGLGGSILGVKKTADAADLDLFLGKKSSPTTVYFVSDWFCPACKKAEPAIEKMVPELAKSVKVGFVDMPIHKESLNFTPYNLQFLAFEKEKYLSLRSALAKLALKTKSPGEAEVQAAVNPLGVKLRQMNYADTLFGMQSNLTVYRGFNVTATPTAIITNSKTKKSKLLVGDRDINEQAIKAAINEVGR